MATTPSPTKTQKKSDPVLEQVSSSSGSVAAGSTFLSTVLDNSQDNGQAATWDKIFVPKADLPSGVNLVVQVRTGNTATPDSTWSAWTAVANGGAVPNAGARYLQYRVSLNIPSGQTVRLPVGFDIDVTSVASTQPHASTKNDRVASLPTASGPVLTGIPGMSPTKPSVSPVVCDAGQGMTWQSLSWTTASLPSGATMVLEVSTGDTSTPDRTWSSWTPVANCVESRFQSWNSDDSVHVLVRLQTSSARFKSFSPYPGKERFRSHTQGEFPKTIRQLYERVKQGLPLGFGNGIFNSAPRFDRYSGRREVNHSFEIQGAFPLTHRRKQ